MFKKILFSISACATLGIFVSQISFIQVFFVSCAQREKKAERNEEGSVKMKKIEVPPAINYLKLLQGPWEDDAHKVYYVNGESYKIFEYRKFSTHSFELNDDTLSFFAMKDRVDTYKAMITSISKDTLTVKSNMTGTRKFWRPAKETLQKDTLSFDLISLKEKRILGNNFVFKTLSDYEDHIYLEVGLKDCKDSCLRLMHDLYYRGGNCNWTTTRESVFEVKGDKLIIYSEAEDVEHMDDRYPHSSTEYIKETYAIRKSGDIIRLKTERGSTDSLVFTEVIKKQIELEWKKD